MKVTDYIISFLIEKGITDIFGYPGGVICHLMDSASKFPLIKAHTNYHAQGAAFAACGYAQSTGKLGVAYSTSGPGATNLVTGIANAYYDSIPTLFLTGQVDTYAERGDFPVRQRGFQETEVVSMVKNVTKYAIRVDNIDDIKYCLEKAYYIAFEGNPGPVLLDLPADIQRAYVDIDSIRGFLNNVNDTHYESSITIINELLQQYKRPLFLVGNGVKLSFTCDVIQSICESTGIPAIFSMPAFDVLPTEHPLNYGYLGGNGHKRANIIVSKADLIITIGSRLCIRQIGLAREKFAPNAKLVRIDIDREGLNYMVHNDEISIEADLKIFLAQLKQKILSGTNYNIWRQECDAIRKECISESYDLQAELIKMLSCKVPSNYDITLDVGLNQLICAINYSVKSGQHVYMSAGHGAMGYSVPAAIGVCTGLKKPVISFNGDGGLMMNVQELQYIKRDKLPIVVVCINNNALGMIKGFQERNFNKNYINTTKDSGYLSVNLKKLADAFEINYHKITTVGDFSTLDFNNNEPQFIEIAL